MRDLVDRTAVLRLMDEWRESDSQRVFPDLFNKICALPGAHRKYNEMHALLSRLAPMAHHIAWLGQCYNDHNFDASDAYRHARAALDAIGIKRSDGVEAWNDLIAEIDAALERK